MHRAVLFLLFLAQGLSQMSESAGREYHRIQEPKNWTEAWDYCRSVFTDLASVRNPEEWEEVSHYAQQGEWVGLHKDNQTSTEWKWTTGEIFNYSNWEPWKPQEFSTSSLSCVYTSGNQWFDTECDIPLPFICHKELPRTTAAPELAVNISARAETQTVLRDVLHQKSQLPPQLLSSDTIIQPSVDLRIRDLPETLTKSEPEVEPIYPPVREADLPQATMEVPPTGSTQPTQALNAGQLEVSTTTKSNSWAVQPTKASGAAPASGEGDASADWATNSSETGLHLISKLSGRSYHLVSETKSWAQAREHCQRMFTDLASIPSREEEEVIIRFAAPGERLWIGLYNDGQPPNGWKWTTGESFSYNNWAPWYTEDFNATFPICAYIDVGQWMDTDCDITLSFMCYKAQNQTILSADREYFLIEEEKTWNKAWSYCRNHYTNLVSMRSAEEAGLVSRLMHRPCWIGLYTDGMSGWMWTNGDPFRYSKWGLWHPYSFNNSLPMCVTIFDGEWHEADCDFPFNFICYQDLKSSSKPPGLPARNGGPAVRSEILYGSKDYSDLLSDLNVDSAPKRLYHKVNGERTWPDARDYCRLHYTDLLSIQSEQESNATRALFGELRQGWCGLYNEWQMADSWEWADGSPVTYVHWKPGQPHRYSLLSPVCVYVEEGQWIDAPCRYLLPFVCYTDLLQGAKQQVFAPVDFDLLSSVDEQSQISILSARSPFADPIPMALTKEYVLVKREKMWIEAQNHCRAEYSELASIQSLEENVLVAQVLRTDVPAWIGLFNRHQSEYSWMWANGDEFNFSNWDHFYPMDFSTMSVCVIMLNGRWKDVPCDFKFPFVCYTAAVREIVWCKTEYSQC
ncbi:C-type mannose receptor 2-like [Mobula hypostoma]|uniref:C-type mannose receptor 2-like n=1 Tax=Mobula hypostoma TaxID=723540 RepID=UPI002FC281F0